MIQLQKQIAGVQNVMIYENNVAIVGTSNLAADEPKKVWKWNLWTRWHRKKVQKIIIRIFKDICPIKKEEVSEKTEM